MKTLPLTIVAAIALFSPSLARSQIFYDSLSSANRSQGFVNPNQYFGDAISLSGTSAIVTSLSFRIGGSVFGPASPTFQAFFYDINPGSGGFQTGDETFGTLLGSSSSQSISVSSGSTVTLSGFSITVPQNFIWIIRNPNADMQLSAINAAGYSTVVGGSSAVTSGYWSSTAPTVGGSLVVLSSTGTHALGTDFAVQLGGSMVPEPSAGALLVLGAGVLAVIRRRKA